MRFVRSILDKKGRDIWSVSPELSVYDAIHRMAEKEIGALLVMEGETLVGILSERDYARQIILKGRSSSSTRVDEIMVRDVITATPQDSVATCMSLMTDNRIRHLPVLDGQRVVGVVSIGDLVNSIIDEQQSTIDDLERYISG